jgi:hypothetical protein
MNNKISGVKLFKNSEEKTLKQAEAGFSVYSEGVLELRKIVDKPEEYYVEGDQISFDIVLKNIGDKVITDFKLKDDMDMLGTTPYFFHGTALNEMLAKKTAKYMKKYYPNTVITCFKGKFHCENALFNPEIMIAELDKIFDK